MCCNEKQKKEHQRFRSSQEVFSHLFGLHCWLGFPQFFGICIIHIMSEGRESSILVSRVGRGRFCRKYCHHYKICNNQIKGHLGKLLQLRTSFSCGENVLGRLYGSPFVYIFESKFAQIGDRYVHHPILILLGPTVSSMCHATGKNCKRHHLK